jgi:hypothetical protein
MRRGLWLCSAVLLLSLPGLGRLPLPAAPSTLPTRTNAAEPSRAAKDPAISVLRRARLPLARQALAVVGMVRHGPPPYPPSRSLHSGRRLARLISPLNDWELWGYQVAQTVVARQWARLPLRC